jgi:hypothetical protein
MQSRRCNRTWPVNWKFRPNAGAGNVRFAAEIGRAGSALDVNCGHVTPFTHVRREQVEPRFERFPGEPDGSDAIASRSGDQLTSDVPRLDLEPTGRVSL